MKGNFVSRKRDWMAKGVSGKKDCALKFPVWWSSESICVCGGVGDGECLEGEGEKAFFDLKVFDKGEGEY